MTQRDVTRPGPGAIPSSGPSAGGDRQAFYDRLSPHSLAPLWEVLRDIVPPEPRSRTVPHLWRYRDLHPLLVESGALLSAEEAERRVLVLENPALPGQSRTTATLYGGIQLVLENPALPGQSRTTATLYGGIQLVLPGETAPAHRHTPSALRFVIEGERGFTAVGGERTTMRAGDLVITPAWAWHDHGNEGDEPVIWLDGLDIPIAGFFEAIFMEPHNAPRHEVTRPEGDSSARFGSGLLPLRSASPYGATSPVFNYPYERTREALVTAARGAESDPHEATTLRYANPIDGGWAMPTIATWMTHLGAGTRTVPIRSTDGMVVHVAEGSGTARVGDRTLAFEAHDTLAVPGWQWRAFEARSDCFLFCFSDRVVQEKLGLWREERAPA